MSAKIESILFFKSEPLAVKVLAKMFSVDESKIEEALQMLEKELGGRGVRLARTEGKVALMTAPDMAPFIESLIKDELNRDLGKAGFETLTTVLYMGPITRAQIDYIRGVNSTYILRHLLLRGLVEKVPNKNDSRSYLYQATFDTLSYLGVTKVEELPEYIAVREEMNQFANQETKDDV